MPALARIGTAPFKSREIRFVPKSRVGHRWAHTFASRRQPVIRRLEIESIAQILPRFQDALQERAVWALREKCRILWAMLDAVRDAYGMGPAPAGGAS